MKTYRHLYPQVYEFENLYLAYLGAKRGKSGKVPVAAFMRTREEELFRLQDELQRKEYQPGLYHSFYIHDPKKRLISAAPFRDRVVHHALCQVIEPIWERRFIDTSYANRIGKGTHRALDCAQQFSRRYPYVLQIDIRQFFPSIDHAILRGILAHHIPDGEILWLIDAILQSGAGVLSEEYQMVWFPGDDLLTAARPRGLPIGNLTSQFWANVYLNELDHYVKRDLKCAAYVRYVDDFLLFSDQKATLHIWRQAIIEKLAQLRLTLHEGSAQVFPVQAGIPFLGFRLYPDFRLLKSRRVITYRHKLKQLVGQIQTDFSAMPMLQASMQGWINHVRYGNTWGLRRSLFRGIRL
jgi:retron-type reverse transcriptase